MLKSIPHKYQWKMGKQKRTEGKSIIMKFQHENLLSLVKTDIFVEIKKKVISFSYSFPYRN